MARTFDALEKAAKKTDNAGDDVTRMFDSPRVAKRKALLGPKASSRMTEEYARLRQSIVAATPELKARVLLFTSSTEGEEAATVLANFGRMLARSGERVLLVDTDLRGPMLHGLFSMDGGPGVAQLFSGKSELPAVMQKAEIEGLFVVAAGSPVANPFSLFESASIDTRIEEMRKEADWVLLTAPPVNAFNDAVALAKKVDGVVLVVEAEQTRWEVAQSAKERLEDASAKILGVVLNNRKFHIPGWIYKRL